MNVISTRDAKKSMDALLAVLQGISEEGGLFVPSFFPKLDLNEFSGAARAGYPTLAAKTLALFFDLPESELLELTQEAYASFDTQEVAPLTRLSHAHVLELWHGPTLAFKDMALQVLPRLMTKALAAQDRIQNILILTATSGDTGKAALEGFKDVPRTGIVVYYPKNGVARMQQLQMETQEGKNTCVCAVEGNFDDAQTGVKRLFGDQEFISKMHELGFSLSSANSINFGRLIPQVAYYIYAYMKLAEEGSIAMGDPINICVPTGNFGNILAAYYAKRMGLPVKTLICASNTNNILTDFFKTGEYDVNRTFHKTMSPSMDILISSNLERLLFELYDRDDRAVTRLMDDLKKTGRYELKEDLKEVLGQEFYADYATEEDTAHTIHEVFEQEHYLMDPHTAVAMHVYESYRRTSGDRTPTVVASTANPYKFTPDVLFALTDKKEKDAFLAAGRLKLVTGEPIPPRIAELKTKEILHDNFARKDELGDVALHFAGGQHGRN